MIKITGEALFCKQGVVFVRTHLRKNNSVVKK